MLIVHPDEAPAIDLERAALIEDYRLMFGSTPATDDVTLIRAAIDSGEPVLY